MLRKAVVLSWIPTQDSLISKLKKNSGPELDP